MKIQPGRSFRALVRWCVGANTVINLSNALFSKTCVALQSKFVPSPRHAPHPVILKYGDLHDLMVEMLAIRDTDARQSPYAYVGIFDLTANQPKAVLDMMRTADSWLVGEFES
jgi:hypothetical protein